MQKPNFQVRATLMLVDFGYPLFVSSRKSEGLTPLENPFFPDGCIFCIFALVAGQVEQFFF